jgi:hypothetical protein
MPSPLRRFPTGPRDVSPPGLGIAQTHALGRFSENERTRHQRCGINTRILLRVRWTLRNSDMTSGLNELAKLRIRDWMLSIQKPTTITSCTGCSSV